MNRLGYLVLALILLFVGRAWGEGATETVTVTRVDSVVPAEYERRVEALTLERDGIRARLEAIEARPPRIITRTDTLTIPPDTVIRFVAVDSRGSLSLDLLTARDSLYAPELHEGIDISDCDEGYTIEAGEVTCDRAALGHLYVGPIASRRPSLALWWQPSFRSPWEAGVSYSGAWDVWVRRGVRLF